MKGKFKLDAQKYRQFLNNKFNKAYLNENHKIFKTI